MEIFKIAAVGLITAFCALTLQEQKNGLTMAVTIAGSCIIVFMLVDYFSDIFSLITNLIEKAGLNNGIVKSILKIIGIGYITEFSAGIIEDTGYKSVSEKVIMAGKVIILIISLPILTALFDIIAGIL